MKNRPKNLNSELAYEVSSRLDTITYMNLLSKLDWYIYDSLNSQLYHKINFRTRICLSTRLYRYFYYMLYKSF
jgi:hypothetical protein